MTDYIISGPEYTKRANQQRAVKANRAMTATEAHWKIQMALPMVQVWKGVK